MDSLSEQYKLVFCRLTERCEYMIIAAINHPEEAERFAQSGADAMLIPVSGLSVRQEPELDAEELRRVIHSLQKMNVKVYLNVLKILHATDLARAELLMDLAVEEKVDGLYIADEGWIVLARDAGYQGELIYQPETLVTNGMDAQFYIDQGLSAVSLAHELSLAEIEACAKDCSHLEVLVYGYYSWMSSRRPLVSNYLREICLEKKVPEVTDPEHEFFLREAQRDAWLRVEERETGTTIWSARPVSSFFQMPALLKAGIRRFRIDTSFLKPEEAARIITLYQKLEQGADPAELNLEGILQDDSLYLSESLTRKEKSRE